MQMGCGGSGSGGASRKGCFWRIGGRKWIENFSPSLNFFLYLPRETLSEFVDFAVPLECGRFGFKIVGGLLP
jgi:hypothetical protein